MFKALLFVTLFAPTFVFASVTKTYTLTIHPHAQSYDDETFIRHYKIVVNLTIADNPTADAAAYEGQSCQYRSNGDIEIPYGCVPACGANVKFNVATVDMQVQDLTTGRVLKAGPVTMTAQASEQSGGACKNSIPEISLQKTGPMYQLTELSVQFGDTKKSTQVVAVDVNELSAHFHNVGKNSYRVTRVNAPENLNGTVHYSESDTWKIWSLVTDGKLNDSTHF